MAVYTPALMLQDPGALSAVVGYPAEVAYVVVKACLGIVLWGAAVVGFLATPMARMGAGAGARRRLAAGAGAAVDRRGRLRAGARLDRLARLAAGTRRATP